MADKTFTLLTVDDNPDIHAIVERTVVDTEFSILKATDGREGIRIAQEKEPDLILLDIHMPSFDGFMISNALKRNMQTQNIPIVFLTGKKSKEDFKKAIRSGGEDYIVKPFSPSDLLTRVRRVIATHQSAKSATPSSSKHKEESSPQEKDIVSITKHGDVAIFTTPIKLMTIDNTRFFAGIFANVTNEGIFKIVFDMSSLEWIDGAGLGILISLNESLKSYGGELRMVFPVKKVNTRFTFIKINDLFRSFSSAKEAVASFAKPIDSGETDHSMPDLNICLTCTFANNPEARYCSYCGTNLVLGKGENILRILKEYISRKVLAEAQSNNADAINKIRDITREAYKIPSQFHVEILYDSTTMTYISEKTDTAKFKTDKIIGVEAPKIPGISDVLRIGIPIQLANPSVGLYAKYSTAIESVDSAKNILYVDYDEDAVALHSHKNFSVAPSTPFTVVFTVPTLLSAQNTYDAKILELSRTRMIVFANDPLPIHNCMAVRFMLPNDIEISSPFVVAKRGKRKFLYEIEFRIINENESAAITQYMYKRQIEIAKGIQS